MSDVDKEATEYSAGQWVAAQQEPYAAPRCDAGNRWIAVMDYPMDITMGYDGDRLMLTIRHAATSLSLRLNREGVAALIANLSQYHDAMPDAGAFVPEYRPYAPDAGAAW